MAGIQASALGRGAELDSPPPASASASLVHYITQADARRFQPVNITFGLLPPLQQKVRDSQDRHRRQCELGLREFDGWLARAGVGGWPKSIQHSAVSTQPMRLNAEC